MLWVGAVALVAGCGSAASDVAGTPDLSTGCAGVDETVELPTGYGDEPRLLYPLSVVTADLGAGGPTGTPVRVPGDGQAEVRYSDGDVVRFTASSGTIEDAAPSPFPTTEAEAEAEEERIDSITSGMVASGAVVTVETPVPIGQSFLESAARDAAELPASIATALAEGAAFAPIRQSFALGDASFDRTIEWTDGVVSVSSDLTSTGQGGVPGVGEELAMLTGARRPRPGIEFVDDGRYQWIVFVPAGMEVNLDGSNGDRCEATIGDELTGGAYWLVGDGDGDETADLEVTTKGAPDHVSLTKWLG